MTTRTLVVAALGAAALASAGPASAATVSMPFQMHAGGPRVGPQDYYGFTLVAAAGEANRITIEGSSPRSIRVTDSGAPLSAGDNCRPDGGGVLCSVGGDVPPFLQGAALDLGDGSDELRIAGNWGPVVPQVLGGPGDDLISVPDMGIFVDGGPGGDTMRALGGSLTYASRTAGVAVTPDGVANDGEPGEGDDVGPTFGKITGGHGDDEIHAIDAPAPEARTTRVEGGGGNDRLFGGRGDDFLYGGTGDDSVFGGDGDDDLQGVSGADVLRGGGGWDTASFFGASGVDVTLDDRPGDGGPGENDDAGSDIETVIGTVANDRIVGSDGPNFIQGSGGADLVDGAGGPDTVFSGTGGRAIGGAGSDVFLVAGRNGQIEARDGETDEIRCGGASNTYAVDPFDTLANCTPAPLMPERSTIRVRRDGTARLSLRCIYADVTDEPCDVRLYLYNRGAAGDASPLGRARFTLPPMTAEPELVEMRLTRSARRKLAARRRMLVSLRWRAYSDSPPERTTGEYDLKLLAPVRG